MNILIKAIIDYCLNLPATITCVVTYFSRRSQLVNFRSHKSKIASHVKDGLFLAKKTPHWICGQVKNDTI